MSDYLNHGMDILGPTTKVVFEAWYKDRKGDWWCHRTECATPEEAADVNAEREKRSLSGKVSWASEYAVIKRTTVSSMEVVA